MVDKNAIDKMVARFLDTFYWTSEQTAGWVRSNFIERLRYENEVVKLTGDQTIAGAKTFSDNLIAKHFRGQYSVGTDFGFYTGSNAQLMGNSYWDGSVYKRYIAGKACDVFVSSDGTIYFRATNTSGAADATVSDFAVVGTISPTGVFTPTGGINLGNETLTVYDENTWTPAVGGTVSDGTIDGYSVRQGDYTRIGNTVHFRIRVGVNGTVSGGSGDLIITLPITAAASVVGYVANCIWYDASSNVILPVAFFISGGETRGYLVKSGIGFVFTPRTELGTGDIFTVTGSYKV